MSISYARYLQFDRQPTDSAMPSMSPLPYQRSDRVDLRYQPWASLTDDQQSIAAQLGYDQLSWNGEQIA